MACGNCQRHRELIKEAVKSGSIVRTAVTVTNATIALGENAGRKLVNIASSANSSKRRF